MRKGEAAAVFMVSSAALSGAGAGVAYAALDGESARSAAIGVALGWAAMAAGFLLLLSSLDGSGNRFFGAYAAGFLLRLGSVGAAFGLAWAGMGKPEPLLIATASTLLVSMGLEGVVLWAAAPGGEGAGRGPASGASRSERGLSA